MESLSVKRSHVCTQLSDMFKIILLFKTVPPINIVKFIIRSLRLFLEAKKDGMDRKHLFTLPCYIGCSYVISDKTVSLDLNVGGPITDEISVEELYDIVKGLNVEVEVKILRNLNCFNM